MDIWDQAEPMERVGYSASNLLTQLGGICLIGVHAWLVGGLGIEAKDEVLILILPLGIMAFISVILCLRMFFDPYFT